MEHRLVTGGYEFLPFARSRVRALKALGLDYAAQSFKIGGVTIRVRIEPGHEHIHIEGGCEDRIYLVFFKPKLTHSNDGSAIDYTERNFTYYWEVEGTYTFVSSVLPALKKFEACGNYIIENIAETSYSDSTQGGTVVGSTTSSNHYYTGKIMPLGFFDKRLVYFDLSAESSAQRYEESGPTDGTTYLHETGQTVARSDIRQADNLSFSGGYSTTHVRTMGVNIPLDERDTATASNYGYNGWMSGNLIRLKGCNGTGYYSETYNGGAVYYASAATISNVIFSISAKKTPCGKPIDETRVDRGPIINIPASSVASTPPTQLLSLDSTTTAPAQITIGLEDNYQHQWRIALWQNRQTLLNPTKVNPVTGVTERFPDTLGEGALLRTAISSSNVFAATWEYGIASYYIYSYSGNYITTVPYNGFGQWDQRLLMLYNKYLVRTNVLGANTLDDIRIIIFRFPDGPERSVQINVSTGDGAVPGEIPKSMIPEGSYFIRAFRDERDSLPTK